jgi:xylan 1,4-beta-xylosidase
MMTTQPDIKSFEKWKAMGKPLQVTTDQYDELKTAGQLQLFTTPLWKNTHDGKTILTFDLPRQAVLLVKLTW